MIATHKPRARKAPNESALVTAILKTLRLKGINAWRQNSGVQRATYKGRGRHA